MPVPPFFVTEIEDAHEAALHAHETLVRVHDEMNHVGVTEEECDELAREAEEEVTQAREAGRIPMRSLVALTASHQNGEIPDSIRDVLIHLAHRVNDMRAAMNAVMDAQGDQRRERLEAAIDLMQQIENHWAEVLQMAESQEGGRKKNQKRTLRRSKQLRRKKTLRRKNRSLPTKRKGGEWEANPLFQRAYENQIHASVPSLRPAEKAKRIAEIEKKMKMVDALKVMIDRLKLAQRECHGEEWRECALEKTGAPLDKGMFHSIGGAIEHYSRYYTTERTKLDDLISTLPFHEQVEWQNKQLFKLAYDPKRLDQGVHQEAHGGRRTRRRTSSWH